MGLDKPLVEQYVIYLKNLLRGDLGTSLTTQRKVIEDIKSYFPATIELVAVSLLFSLILGMTFGVISAVKWDTKIDHVLRAFSVAGVSFPQFWLGIVLLLIFYVKLDVAPGVGRIAPKLMLARPFETVTGLYLVDTLIARNIPAFLNSLHHLLLPAFCLSLSPVARIVRITRASMLDVLNMDYILAARAKGLRESIVVLKHGLRNALNPIITIFFLTLGYSLGGAVLIEKIFAWPGMGRYAFMAATNLDYPAIQGVALLAVISIALANLAADIAYMVADPQIRLQ
jgi:peptide/nickel transport system permease protein